MPPRSTGSATNLVVSGIVESLVSSDLTIPIAPIHTATSRRTNFLPSFCRIARGEVPACRSEANAMELSYTFGEPDVQNAFLLSDLHA